MSKRLDILCDQVEVLTALINKERKRLEEQRIPAAKRRIKRLIGNCYTMRQGTYERFIIITDVTELGNPVSCAINIQAKKKWAEVQTLRVEYAFHLNHWEPISPIEWDRNCRRALKIIRNTRNKIHT